ncbi:MAG: ADP-glyceromanno-heptose 6-epimerase [Tistlia sp.]|uniref:ADP-glyceromanno-heptose 6-epimerase n=1 Tax=Tistlia sp. TaxID=3057121 RepID=UPI0034A5C62C
MILVTGGAGFIGSNLVAALDARTEPVAVSDWLGEGDKWRNLAKRELEALIRPEALDDWLEERGGELDLIYHLGAVSSTTETDADRLVANNLLLSQKLWTWCAENGVPLIYASSAATYGDGAQGFDDSLDRAYLAGLRPLNAYGWSKHAFDRWVARRVEEGWPHPPHWAGLKFFNVYGPNEYHKGGQASVAWHLFGQLARGEPARLFRSHRPDYADGGQLRDFVHVEDCVEAMLWLGGQPEVSGLFNVGSGKARSFLDLASGVFAALGQEPRVEFVPTPEPIREKYQYFTEARLDRLRAAGFQHNALSLEEGLRRYVQDFLAGEDPYR